ncbi:helix-turn-helix domain-containing protein [Lysobacter enzymogenes]|uniref:helix-turn-helix domain-containing protein n=1 Tax=Lysobacter enzymogenes TaxID=69 RepID=UPI001A95736F|nr:helix-turn-helix transcriptional regulator [Lysobacter enzymogenes]QQP96517.1 helix-turn-helix domain-containing protein [Lysobacter enzymogenes]
MKKLDPTLTGQIKGDTLGARMLASRTNARMTQKVAAMRIGISPGQLGRIERGAVGMVNDPHTLVWASRAYGVSDVWLYAGATAGAHLVPDWYEAPDMEKAA